VQRRERGVRAITKLLVGQPLHADVARQHSCTRHAPAREMSVYCHHIVHNGRRLCWPD
jgi:hypothetical protein